MIEYCFEMQVPYLTIILRYLPQFGHLGHFFSLSSSEEKY